LGTILYRVLFGIDALAFATAVFFFLWGLSDGTVSSFNAGIWALLLLGVTAVPAGGLALRKAGRTALANLLLLALAGPVFLAALMLLMFLVSPHHM
jgi:hypothetical protein